MDWVRQQSSTKGGVLLLVSLVWDGSYVSVHHDPIVDLQDSAELDLTIRQSAAGPESLHPLPPTHHASLPPGHATEPGGKQNDHQEPGTELCRGLTHTDTHTHCTVYNTQPHSQQIKTVKKTLHKSTTWYLKINCTCGNKLNRTMSGKGRTYNTVHSKNKKKKIKPWRIH